MTFVLAMFFLSSRGSRAMLSVESIVRVRPCFNGPHEEFSRWGVGLWQRVRAPHTARNAPWAWPEWPPLPGGDLDHRDRAVDVARREAEGRRRLRPLSQRLGCA